MDWGREALASLRPAREPVAAAALVESTSTGLLGRYAHWRWPAGLQRFIFASRPGKRGSDRRPS